MPNRVLAALLAFGLAGCGGPASDISGSYVGGDDTAVLQLNLVEKADGEISGNLAFSELDYRAGNLKLTNRPISGIRSGEQISLLAHGHDWGPSDTPLSLEVSGNSLVLLMPANGQSLEMLPMNQEEYRKRLADFAEALNANDVGLLPEE